jgi:hypothetical protein
MADLVAHPVDEDHTNLYHSRGGSRRSSSRLDTKEAVSLRKKYFVHITPAPALARFNGPHNGMLGLVKVLGGMSVLGRVAATYVTAYQTFSQVHPGVAHFLAFLAAFAGRLHVTDLAHV